MKKTVLLISGATGFIGRNLINTLEINNNYEYYIVDKTFTSCFPRVPDKVDWVIHLASSHREKEEQLVYQYNAEINSKLVNFLEKTNLQSNILFTSSVQEGNDTFYGKSKREGTLYLKTNCENWGKTFKKLTLPNIFGPFAKPNHTSVVANFCFNIIKGKESYINDVSIQLAYIADVVQAILSLDGQSQIKTKEVRLKELYESIEQLHEKYKVNKSVMIKSRFHAQLLATYLSYT
ncbi:MAG: NAD-dependent epimerase/dehydratase family protein [Jejuia sp.]